VLYCRQGRVRTDVRHWEHVLGVLLRDLSSSPKFWRAQSEAFNCPSCLHRHRVSMFHLPWRSPWLCTCQYPTHSPYRQLRTFHRRRHLVKVPFGILSSGSLVRWNWQDLHDDDKTCMQVELLRARIGEWTITRMLDYWRVMCFTGYRLKWNPWTWIPFPLIWIAPFSTHKLIEQVTAVLHQAIIV
jgi:hypothetical protein